MVSFKLRRLQPCWIGAVEYNVDLPDDDIVQVMLYSSVSHVLIGRFEGGKYMVPPKHDFAPPDIS